MPRLLPVLILVAALTACLQPFTEARARKERSHSNKSPAVTLERNVRRLAAQGASRGSLWPGFDPLAIPLAVYDGERTFLFRHPAPPPGFLPDSGTSPTAYAGPGRHEAVTANTNSKIGGVPTATVILDLSLSDGALLDLAAVAIHEAFHVYQRARHPGWIGNEADLFTFPADSPELLALRRLETEALRQGLAAKDTTVAACWARRALALRGERYARMDSAFVAYERGTELNEGLATYVQMRAAGRSRVDLPPGEFGPAEVRRRAYATGPALALLLDQFAPEWPAAFEANDRQTLDGALTAAVGPGTACTSGDAVRIEAERNARVDIAALAAERAHRLALFEAKPGWRVVVEPGASEPLWPQGFDPINVDCLGPGQVLHARFLQLGNGAGKLEVLNAESLTEGLGPHPLFQGVGRVVVTGLAEPTVSEAEGKLLLRAPGLTLEFRGASVVRREGVVTVRVGS